MRRKKINILNGWDDVNAPALEKGLSFAFWLLCFFVWTFFCGLILKVLG